MESKPILILGYFGIGKTTYINNHPEKDIVDLGGPPDVESIRANEHHQYIVADPDWLVAFLEYGQHFNIVIPEQHRRAEFLRNWEKRRNGGMCHKHWINKRNNDWYSTLTLLQHITDTTVTVLDEGQYLSDIIELLK